MNQLPDLYRAVHIHDVVGIRPDLSEDTAYPRWVIPKEFKRCCEERGDAVAMVSCDGVEISWKSYYDQSHRFAQSLLTVGVQPFDTITVIGFNTPEYLFTVMGSIEAGCVATGIYTTNTPDACLYVMNHCKSRVIVVNGMALLNKILSIRTRLPNLTHIIVYNVDAATPLPQPSDAFATVESWTSFLSRGSTAQDTLIESRVASLQPGNCLSLIYTSGTTGNPKAAMISHDNVGFVCQVIRDDFKLSNKDRVVSYLPLSHIAAQMIDIFAAALLGMTVFFAFPDALKGSLALSLRNARPTVFVAVPRVYEKMAEMVAAKLETASWLQRKVAAFCRKKGLLHTSSLQLGAKPRKVCFYKLACKLLLNKVKHVLGLDAAKLLFSAAAPIELSTVSFFASLDLPLFEIYGMSETAGPATFHTPQRWRMGTAGPAMRGSVVKRQEGSGEIVVNGRHVFMGYLEMPEETLRVLEKDGVLHSGDCGEVDADGLWRITGRLKELIVTAGGENIPPVLIESRVKQLAPGLSNVVVIGDRRKYLSALLTLYCDEENRLAGPSLELAKQLGSSARTAEEACKDASFLQYCADVIQQYNACSFSNAQK